jgi:hypothetical protein
MNWDETILKAGTDISRRLGAVALACTALAGCGGATIAPDATFPDPIVEPVALHMGLYLEEQLTTYIHTEEIELYGEWSVDVGQVQPVMFKKVVGAMFSQVTEVNRAEAPDAAIDGVIAPTIEAFQIAIPAQTRGEFYEVWIKYRIRLLDPEGNLIVEWPLTAYGKANREDYKLSTNEPAMEEATKLALRDAGAFLAIRFTQVPEVKAWLDGQGISVDEGET